MKNAGRNRKTKFTKFSKTRVLYDVKETVVCDRNRYRQREREKDDEEKRKGNWKYPTTR